MSCYCFTTVIPPANPCSGCLQVNGLRVGCADGPEPCGNTVQINLAEKNDLTICTGVPVWSLKYWDPIAFTNVTLNQSGLLSFDTTNYYKHGKEFRITYEVDCPNSIHRAEADIWVCFKNPCDDGCTDCNPCTGNCLSASDGTANGIITSEGCPEVVNSFDLKTISTYTDCGTGITYDLTYPETIFTNVSVTNGVISYTVLAAAVSGATYTIQYKMTCPDFAFTQTATLTVTVKTKCHDVECAEGEVCDLCTGLCGPIPPEIGIGGAGNNPQLTIS